MHQVHIQVCMGTKCTGEHSHCLFDCVLEFYRTDLSVDIVQRISTYIVHRPICSNTLNKRDRREGSAVVLNVNHKINNKKQTQHAYFITYAQLKNSIPPQYFQHSCHIWYAILNTAFKCSKTFFVFEVSRSILL